MNIATIFAGCGSPHDACAAVRDRVASRLAPAQIVVSQRLVWEFIEEHGEGELHFDYEEAVRWWRKAAEQGYAAAQFQIGHAYLRGKGVKKDIAEAARWHLEAYRASDPETHYDWSDDFLYLGDFYYRGDGVTQDYTEAVTWFRKGIPSEFGLTERYLGDCYFNGTGVEQNYEEALHWEAGNTRGIARISTTQKCQSGKCSQSAGRHSVGLVSRGIFRAFFT